MKKNAYFLLLSIILIVCSSNIHWSNKKYTQILFGNPDSKGYYAYLPAIFIYDDLQFRFEDNLSSKKDGEINNSGYRIKKENNVIDKYFCGTAIAELPFFIAGHLLSKLVGTPLSGYSIYYLISINLAAIFYTLLGLLYLSKVLSKYKIDLRTILIVNCTLLFGTQLFYYTVCEPGMSHAYSFGLISCLIFHTKEYFESNKRIKLIFISLLLGLIVLIRPVDLLICLLLPFLSDGIARFKATIISFSRSILNWIYFILPFLLVVSLQFIIYKIQTGSFIQYSYGEEGFNWSKPELINLLFSYKKGLFLYTPILIFSALGLFKLFRKNKYQFTILFFGILIILFVTSCWWNWWYGWSFSSRPMTDYLSVFGILLGFFIYSIKNSKARNLYVTFIFLLIIVCQVQTFQYRHFIIHPENMDKEHYWRVFMRVDQLIGDQNPNEDLL